MGVYQRHGNFMVFYHDETGKRRDKSFGKAADSEYRANAFDKLIKEAKKNDWRESSDSIVNKFFSVAKEQTQKQNAVSDTRDNKPTCTFGVLCKAYIQELEISGRSESHIKIIKGLLESVYFKHLDKDKDANSFTYLDNISPFLQHIATTKSKTGKKRSQCTINRYGDYLDAIFNFGVRVGLIDKNPVKGRQKAKVKPRAFNLNVDDLKKIMDAASPHIRWAMEVCFNLGTRSGDSELLSLQWSDVDFENKHVRIFGRKTKEYRIVPINDYFLQRLSDMKLVAKTDYIIEFRGSKVNSLRKGFNEACKKAGITYETRMYDIRHLYATVLLSNGADLAAVSKLMGHSRITMTANVYYHCMADSKEKAVSLLPNLNSVNSAA